MGTDVVYLTGASGFIGANLQRLLPDLGVQRIVTVARSGAALDYEAFTQATLEPGSAVVHLAGKAHDLRGEDGAEQYETANVALTERVYETFRTSAAEVFVFASSVKAVADSVDGVLQHDAQPHPSTLYGRSKLRAERHLADHQPRPHQRVHVLRLCLVHGPGVKGNLALLDRLVAAGLPYPLGAFENRRSILSVDNLAYVVSCAFDGRLPPGTYNVADDEPLSTPEMVRILAHAHGGKANILRLPPGLIQALAKIGDRLPVGIGSDRLSKLTESYVVDTAPLLHVLGVDHLPLAARAGLSKLARADTTPRAHGS